MKKHILSLLVSVGLIGSASAAVVLSNIENQVSGYASVSQSHTAAGFQVPIMGSPSMESFSSQNAYISFQTGNDSYTLNSVTFILGSFTSSGPLTWFSSNLYTDKNGSRDQPIFSLLNGSIGSQSGEFIPTSNTILTSNTKYWLGLNISAAQSISYTISQQLAVTTDANYFSQDGWAMISSTANTPGSLMYSVSATAVPEPSTYALFGIGAIGMLVVLARKRGGLFS